MLSIGRSLRIEQALDLHLGHGRIGRPAYRHVLALAIAVWLLNCLAVPQATIAPADPIRKAFLSDLTLAGAGDLRAELKVGRAYYNGTGTALNYARAVKWLQAASAQGSIEADAWLGSCYIFGRGVPEDQSKGTALIRKAADANDPVGLRFLAVMYESGRGLQQDRAKALSLFIQSAALNDARSLVRLGNMYQHGTGVEQDIQKARELFKTGAQLGDDWAELNLGDMYLGSQGSGNAPDYKMALKLYGESASHGNRVAAFRLAKMYDLGRGTAANPGKALEYYRMSAQRGYVPAEIALAGLHEKQGAPMDMIYAYVLYSVAANQGNPVANEHLTILNNSLSQDQIKQGNALLARWNKRKTEDNHE